MTLRNIEKRLLNRREVLRLLGAAGATAMVGGGGENVSGLWPTANLPVSNPGSIAEAAGALSKLVKVGNVIAPALFTPVPRVTMNLSQLSCITKPSLTEGPFFVDELLNRNDIRLDPSNSAVKPGVPLKIKFNVGRVSGSSCAALVGAFVDLWHCDASGGYSDVSGQGNPNNSGQKFLRGYQVTDSNGSVEFTTIYPGWYSGRTVHLHYKVRLFAGLTERYDFTSQLCFDDTLTDQVFTQAPYNSRGTRNTRNSNDNIYQSAGTAILLNLTSDGAGGFTTTWDIGLSGVPDSVAAISNVSAASFAGSISPDGIAAIFGTGLASSTLSATTTDLPIELGGVQVFVLDAGGTRRNAGLYFISPSQINFQVPSGTSAGTAFIYVQSNGTVVGQSTANIATVAPGFFTANANGKGVPAAVLLRVKADGSQSYEAVAQFDSAQNGYVALPIDLGASTDQLFLIGFGTGFRNRSVSSALSATLGGVNTEVAYVGAQGIFSGLDQANIAIPRSLAGSGDVDLAFSVDGQTANTVSINIK
jgi:uncharacterized protein (TIGR03437 family)